MFRFNSAEVQRRRIELGLSRQELAARLGISLPTKYRWESGTVIPHRHRVVKLANAAIFMRQNFSSQARINLAGKKPENSFTQKP